VNVRLVMLDVSLVAGRAQLVVVDHFCAGDLWNRGADFGQPSLLPMGDGLNAIRRVGDLRIRWLAATRRERTRAAA